ncbi:MAG: 2-C-methyl-D-erythritol 4-phosphate cytidylyltransferase [Planctomycetota bacterium]
MNLAVIIPAAGGSTRFRQDPGALLGDSFKGAGLGARSKLDEDLGGRPVLHRTVELFTSRPEVQSIIVAAPHDDEAHESFCLRHQDKLNVYGVTICRGGAQTRAQTVASALEKVPDGATHIAVHDGARPCASEQLIDRVLEAAGTHSAVIPAVEVTDALKRGSEETTSLGGDDDPLAAILGDSGTPKREARTVTESVDRTNLYAAQTPQVFEAVLLKRAYAEAGDLSDAAVNADDAALIERLGEPVTLVQGDEANIKITRPIDLTVARAILGFKPPKERPDHLKF